MECCVGPLQSSLWPCAGTSGAKGFPCSQPLASDARCPRASLAVKHACLQVTCAGVTPCKLSHEGGQQDVVVRTAAGKRDDGRPCCFTKNRRPSSSKQQRACRGQNLSPLPMPDNPSVLPRFGLCRLEANVTADKGTSSTATRLQLLTVSCHVCKQ